MKITYIPIQQIHTRLTSEYNAERPARKPVMAFDDPVVVIAVEDGYEIVDGLRRIEALLRDGAAEVPAVVQDWSGVTARMMRILLNGRRKTISWYEEALLVRDLHENEKIPLVRIARQLGRKESWVRRRHEIAVRLSEPLMAFSYSGDLGLMKACAISRLPEQLQMPFFLACTGEHLRAREMEWIVTVLLEMDEAQRRKAVRSPGAVLQRLQRSTDTGAHDAEDLSESMENLREKIRLFRTNGLEENNDLRVMQTAVRRLNLEIELLTTAFPDNSGDSKIRIPGREDDSRGLSAEPAQQNPQAKSLYPLRAGHGNGGPDGLVPVQDYGGKRPDTDPCLFHDSILEPVSVPGDIH